VSFTNRIERFDADYGIPRRADEAYLPAYHAFLRCSKDAVQIGVLLLLGALSSICLWQVAGNFQAGFIASLIYAVFIALIIGVAFAEASQVFLPYYRFNQLLTYGTANWATPVHLEGAGFACPVNQPLKQGELQLGKIPRALRSAYSFVLPSQAVLGSLIFFGPPGAGKSVLLMNYLRMWSQNGKGGSAVILDPKGELYEYCARYFRKVYRLDFQNPACSDRWNFIPNCKGSKEYAHAMASIMLGIEGTKYVGTDPFWQEAELALLTAILLYLPTIVDHPTPPMIHEFIALRSFEQLCAELEGSENYDVNVQWGTFNKAPEATRGSVFTGLAAKINPFTIDAAKAVTATIRTREYKAGARYIDFEELREEGVAIFVVIPEGAASRYKTPLMTFLGQAVETLRESVVTENTTPVLFVCDEAAHIPIVNLKEIAGVGRGRKFAVALFYQNMSQGYDMYGEHGFNAILGSITTKTFLPGCDDVTATYAARLAGQTTVWGHTFDDAPGTQYDKTRTTEAARSLIDPSEVRQLLKHKQAITITETMPPVKWTFPKSAKTGARLMPQEYGRPRVFNFLEAEQHTTERRYKGGALQIAAHKEEQALNETDKKDVPDEACLSSASTAIVSKEAAKPEAAQSRQTITLTRTGTDEQVLETAVRKGMEQLSATVAARRDRTEKFLNQTASQ
jgi:type IV secretory pathway TraG/TraD family ATPase VirD4